MWTNAPLYWGHANTVNPERRGPELWIFSNFFLALATFCVGCRLYSRLFVRRWLGPDDYLVILGYVSLCPAPSCQLNIY